jgi:rSAM/selenodomain-associated transferase 1
MTDRHRLLSPDQPDPAAAGLCALAIMTKVPRPGEVKTRLSPPLTPEEAAELNYAFLQDTAGAIAQAGPLARGIGCYTPVGMEGAYREVFPPAFQLIAQRPGSFGERLTGATADLFAVGFASVCLIDSDSPTVPASCFSRAVQILATPNDRVVLGPSGDGGYYLIGMTKLHRELFEDIAWSTDQVLAQTERKAQQLGLEVCLLPAGYDVDDQIGFERLCQELLGPNESRRCRAPATRAFLQNWKAKARAR